jgi:Transposase DDE domain group 1
MVISSSKHTRKTRVSQAPPEEPSRPTKINANTHFDFRGKNLTPYGGLFPVATMLEKLKFQQLLEESLTVKRIPRSMPVDQFILAMVLAMYVGFSRLNHLRYVVLDLMLTRILQVAKLPVQSTFWRFLDCLHGVVARQLLQVTQRMRERVWAAANLRLESITLDTDTTVHTVYSAKKMGARKSYNPKNKGKKSYQPILTFIAETREYIWGELRNGDRPSGKAIARHLESVLAAVPPGVKLRQARADSGFYCSEAVQAYEKGQVQFIMVARKTRRLLAQLRAATWKPSPKTDADEQCEFRYQPERWKKAYRFMALRYEKKSKGEPQEQYQLFDTPKYSYRVFVTNMEGAIDLLVWFYRQRAGAENLIKEANNDAGLAAHPSTRWATNSVHFQLAMLAYNLNCWLMLFHREEGEKTEEMKHTTLATARLRFLFLAAKFWIHNGRVGISYSDQYQERGVFQRLMDRLRNIVAGPQGFAPVLATPLRS